MCNVIYSVYIGPVVMTTEEKQHVGTDILQIEESDKLEHNLQYPTYGMRSILAINALMYVDFLVYTRDYRRRNRLLLL